MLLPECVLEVLKFLQMPTFRRILSMWLTSTSKTRNTRCTHFFVNIVEFQNFRSGDLNKFMITTNQKLGPLRYLHVFHDNSGPDQSASWFLEKIIAHDLTENKKYLSNNVALKNIYFISSAW